MTNSLPSVGKMTGKQIHCLQHGEIVPLGGQGRKLVVSSVLHPLQVHHFVYSLSALEGDHYHPQYLVGAQGSGF